MNRNGRDPEVPFKFWAKQRKFTIAYDLVTGNRYIEGLNSFNNVKSRAPVDVVEDFLNKIYAIHTDSKSYRWSQSSIWSISAL